MSERPSVKLRASGRSMRVFGRNFGFGWRRRDLVVGMLVVQAAVLVAVVGGAPFGVRLIVGLAYVCAVPGFALVGLLRLSDPASEVATSLVVSLMVCTATAQGLVWAGRYSLAATLAVLGAVSTLGLLRQLHTLPRPAVA